MQEYGGFGGDKVGAEGICRCVSLWWASPENSLAVGVSGAQKDVFEVCLVIGEGDKVWEMGGAVRANLCEQRVAEVFVGRALEHVVIQRADRLWAMGTCSVKVRHAAEVACPQ